MTTEGKKNDIDWDEVLDWNEENVLLVLWSDEAHALRVNAPRKYDALWTRLDDTLFEKFGVRHDDVCSELERRMG